jgi:hypothetical protein
MKPQQGESNVVSAQEVEEARRIMKDPNWDADPVHLYNELLGTHGAETTGRIWSLACKIYDHEGGEWG